jgi:4-amino-4-deoxy-L-arabinose transferase-like glycosyltransferase
VLDRGRRHLTAVAWLGASALALVLTLPAVRWEPLHADEIVTLRFARQSFADIVRDVFAERGGAPLHFFVERIALAWPDGLEGLRLPSVVFFVAALPAAGIVSGRLVGRSAARLVPIALALAPLAVGLATFGRMYSLYLSATLWAVVVALWAADRGDPLAWTAAGAAAGLLVYVHPAAPIVSPLVVLTGLLCAEDSLRGLLHRAWPAPLALVLVQLPYYVYALGVLRDRYEVELGAPRAQAIRAAGRSIPEQSLLALGPDGLAGSVFTLVVALGGLAVVARARPSVALAIGLWVVVPVLFFTFVPTGTTFFFARYLLPSLPFFLLLVVAGTLGLASLGRGGVAAGAALLATVLVWQAVDDVRKLDELRGLKLQEAVSLAETTETPRLFGAVGVAPFARRPPRLLDEYVLLEHGMRRAPERSPETLRAFVASEAEPARGVWLFAGPPRRLVGARPRLEDVAGAEVIAVSPSVLLVRSEAPLEPRPLVEQAAALREAWLRGEPEDAEAQRFLRRARTALGER